MEFGAYGFYYAVFYLDPKALGERKTLGSGVTTRVRGMRTTPADTIMQ